MSSTTPAYPTITYPTLGTSNIFDHAIRELKAIGYDVDAALANTNYPGNNEMPSTSVSTDYDVNTWMVRNLLDLVAIYAAQGHSGYSASYLLQTLTGLFDMKNLTPLTTNEEEWHLHPNAGPDESNLWQNKRNGEALSLDVGKTYTLLSERAYDGSAPIHESIDSRPLIDGENNDEKELGK